MLETSKLNVAIPWLSADLRVESIQLQLIVAGFTVAAGLSLIPVGWIGDAGVMTGMVLMRAAGLIQAAFTGQERVRAFALLGVLAGLTNGLGPVIGGLGALGC